MITIDERQGELHRQLGAAASMVKVVMGVANGCALNIMLDCYSELSGKATDPKTGTLHLIVNGHDYPINGFEDTRFDFKVYVGYGLDGTGTISRLVREENAVWVHVKTSAEILRLIVEKGSIAIDGISLTVARVNETEFAVSVIPHTAEETTLLSKKAGDTVNLENDIVGKYVEKLLGGARSAEQTASEKDDKFLKWLGGE